MELMSGLAGKIAMELTRDLADKWSAMELTSDLAEKCIATEPPGDLANK